MIEQLGQETKPTRRSQASGAGQELNYYELLDVPTQATRMQIREAYIRLKATYASGSQALYSLLSDEEAKQTLEKMEEAYRVLDDESLRKDYDDFLGLKREAPKAASGEIFPNGFEVQRPGHGSRLAESTLNQGYASGGSPELRDQWSDDSPDARPIARRVSTFTKIKKFATRAFAADVKEQELDLLAKPQAFDGVVLTQLRELMEVPQSEIQERTKIAIEYIKALENNDYQKLPSLVYVRGFLKIYLQYLGLQDQEAKGLIEAYTEKYNQWREKHRPHSS